MKSMSIDPILIQATVQKGVMSLSDYAGYFTEADYEKGIATEIMDGTALATNRVQLSRMRMTWIRAREQVRVAKASSGQAVTDWEAPLDDDDRKQQDEAFFLLYKIKFEAYVMPADHIFNRLYREFKKRHKSCDDLTRMKSASDLSAILPSETRKQLGDMTLLLCNSSDKIAPVQLGTVLRVLHAHEIMVHAWALTGTDVRPSKVKQNEQVRDADYGECMAYHWFVRQQLMAHPDIIRGTSQQDAVSWFIQRDRETRLKARQLYNDDSWPWCEALRESRERHCAVLWTCGFSAAQSALPILSAGHTDANEPTTPQAKRAKTDTQFSPKAASPQECCQDFNGPKGCTAKQNMCPHKKLHKCSFRNADSTLCGMWQHNKMVHLQNLKTGNKKGF